MSEREAAAAAVAAACARLSNSTCCCQKGESARGRATERGERGEGTPPSIEPDEGVPAGGLAGRKRTHTRSAVDFVAFGAFREKEGS